MLIREHPEDRFWTDLIPSANSLKVMAVVTASSYCTIAEKCRISASFLRVGVEDGIRSEILKNFDLFSFLQAFRQTDHFYFQNTAPYLLKSDSSREGVLFESLLLTTKLFFLVISETSYLHLISRVSINSFDYC